MATGVVGFRTVESVANVLAALQHTTHNGFPIGLSDEGGPAAPRHMRGASYSNLVTLAQLAAAGPGRQLCGCCVRQCCGVGCLIVLVVAVFWACWPLLYYST